MAGQRIQRARRLRAQMTDAERKLWQGLRGRRLNGYKFRRQCPLGPYIVDFVCLEARLVIEVDGGQHLDAPDDPVRDAWLQAEGYRVLHFWNHEILERMTDVLERIWDVLHPYPDTPPLRGRETQEVDHPHGGGRELGGVARAYLNVGNTTGSGAHPVRAGEESGPGSNSPSPLRGEGRDGGVAGAAGPAGGEDGR